MIKAALPANENERLKELYKYELLDTVYEREFDEIVQLASKICKTPISVITLLDTDRQWFKAKLGLDDTETGRGISFCSHTILQDELMEVTDATKDERFHDNPLVTSAPDIRYYAGMPLVTNNGYKLGSLCVIDKKPNKLDEEQVFALKVLSEQVIKLFELRIANKELKKVTHVQQKMLTILAHDIRGPLASLKISNEMKSQGMFAEADVKNIDRLISLQLDSTIGLLDNIVDWSKIQLSEKEANKTLFSLHDLCEKCLNIYAVTAETKGNKLVNDVKGTATIMWNMEALEFIIRNLVGNAVKFTEGGSITVGAIVNNGILKLSVADTGKGMEPAAYAALSNRNWIPSHNGTNNEKGSGFGLKLIFEYFTEMGGDISFEQNTPKGTVVMVTIPLTV